MTAEEQVAAVLGKKAYQIEIGDWACPPRRSDHDGKHSREWFDRGWPPERLAQIARDNPLGLCVYEPDKDPMRDNCLFCGMPDERK